MAKYIPSGSVKNKADFNAEFQKVANAINDQLDRETASGNQMGVDLDMNSNRILNLPTPVAGHEPARLSDLTQIVLDGINTVVTLKEEELLIQAGVTEYTFITDVGIANSLFFIREPYGDLGAKLIKNEDYTLSTGIDDFTLNLTRTYDEGTILQRVYTVFESAGDTVSNIRTTTDLINVFNADVPVGSVIKTQGFNTTGDAGGGSWVKTNITSTASQTPLQRNSASLTDAVGNVWEYVGNKINLNSLGMTTTASCGVYVSLGCQIIRDSISSAESGAGVDPVMPITVTANPAEYFTTTSINATMMNVYQWVLDFEGVSIRGECVGKSVLDLLGSRFGKVRGLLILGDTDARPAIGIQYGRAQNGVSADNLQFENVKTNGYFTRSAAYNRASETELWEHLELYNQIDTVESYCHIFDGNNTWGIISDYITDTIPQYTDMSCIQHTFVNPDWRHGGGRVMWMSLTHQFRIVNGYQVCTEENAITLSATDAGFDDLDFDIHSETQDMNSVFSFEMNPAATGTVVDVRGFKWTEEAGQPSDQYMRAATAVTKVNLYGSDIRLSRNQQTPTNGLFAPANKFVVHGSIYSGSALVLKGLHAHYGTLFTPTLSNATLGVGSYTIYETTTGRTYHKGDFNPISSEAAVITGAQIGTTTSGINFNNGVIELTGRATLPTQPSTGSYIAVDNGENWSGVNATGNPRPVFWDGTQFVAIT